MRRSVLASEYLAPQRQQRKKDVDVPSGAASAHAVDKAVEKSNSRYANGVFMADTMTDHFISTETLKKR